MPPSQLFHQFVAVLYVIQLTAFLGHLGNWCQAHAAVSNDAIEQQQHQGHGSSAQEPCVRPCSCFWRDGKQLALCSDQQLLDVPENLAADTQTIDLSDNPLLVLTARVFERRGLGSLQRILLPRTRLRQIDAEAFAGLTNLVLLELSGNRLRVLPSDALRRTPALRELKLNQNPIETLPAGGLSMLVELFRLELSDCRLHHVDAAAFQGLSRLQWLRLDNNRLATLPVDCLLPLTSIRQLRLHGNPWACDCRVRYLKRWLDHVRPAQVETPQCARPPRLHGAPLTRVVLEQFSCVPQVRGGVRQLNTWLGDNATLTCSVSAAPEPHIQWKRHGQPVINGSAHPTDGSSFVIFEHGRQEKTSQLTVVAAHRSAAGRYVCEATNSAGTVSTSFKLSVGSRRSVTHVTLRLDSGLLVGVFVAVTTACVLLCVCVCLLFNKSRPTRAELSPNNTSRQSSPGVEQKALIAQTGGAKSPKSNGDAVTSRSAGVGRKYPGSDVRGQANMSLNYVAGVQNRSENPLGEVTSTILEKVRHNEHSPSGFVKDLLQRTREHNSGQSFATSRLMATDKCRESNTPTYTADLCETLHPTGMPMSTLNSPKSINDEVRDFGDKCLHKFQLEYAVDNTLSTSYLRSADKSSLAQSAHTNHRKTYSVGNTQASSHKCMRSDDEGSTYKCETLGLRSNTMPGYREASVKTPAWNAAKMTSSSDVEPELGSYQSRVNYMHLLDRRKTSSLDGGQSRSVNSSCFPDRHYPTRTSFETRMAGEFPDRSTIDRWVSPEPTESCDSSLYHSVQLDRYMQEYEILRERFSRMKRRCEKVSGRCGKTNSLGGETGASVALSSRFGQYNEWKCHDRKRPRTETIQRYSRAEEEIKAEDWPACQPTYITSIDSPTPHTYS